MAPMVPSVVPERDGPRSDILSGGYYAAGITATSGAEVAEVPTPSPLQGEKAFFTAKRRRRSARMSFPEGRHGASDCFPTCVSAATSPKPKPPHRKMGTWKITNPDKS